MNGESVGRISYLRIRFSLVAVGVGFLIFVIGAKPNWFGLNRVAVVGFVQIIVFLVGLALICLGGYVGLSALWGKTERSIVADVGLRLVSTGYVITVFTSMADVFGMGAQPVTVDPYFGPWQAAGVVIGQIVIAIGFLMLIPYQTHFTKVHE
jgi:hypothetical protein